MRGLEHSPLSRDLDEAQLTAMITVPSGDPELEEYRQRGITAYKETFGFDFPPKDKAQRRKSKGR